MTMDRLPNENVRDAAVILFTLSPEVDAHRKRLGPRDRSTAIFAALLEHMQTVCSSVRDVDLLVASPADVRPSRGAHLPQRGSSFGESLRLAVEEAFALGYRRVMVVGNDAPEITPSYLRRALARIREDSPTRAVLSPTRDGGYALLGLTRACPAAFERIAWGGSEVARVTLQRLAESGFLVSQLPILDDIDDPRSLARFLARARTTGLTPIARRLLRLLAPAPGPWMRRRVLPAPVPLLSTRALRAPPALS
jgi:glycosyltransferase A (GT-A) superfamily protein (DUF2064 family)